MRAFATLILLLSCSIQARTVHYDLVARRTPVNMSGKENIGFAISINGQIPAPTLYFTEGDDAEIVVKNEVSDEEISLHWHGILLPNEMDGVPYLTTPPIKSGSSYTFKFKIRQNGTYWYHSHTGLQEQLGVYGALVIQPKTKTIHADKDVVAVLSDWSDENPDSILSNLKKDGDYYLYKKGTMRSWIGALSEGSLGNFLQNEWIRMGGMDLSDIGYDAFLINGKKDSELVNARAGEKVRLRIINAGSSSYFHVGLGNVPMNVISADGIDIEPTETKDILMGMAETYDVLFKVPENKSYELKATAQDGTGSASAWIGQGEKVLAPVVPTPKLYATMVHSAHAGHEHMHMHHHEDAGTLTVDGLKAKVSTEFSKKPATDLTLVLDGDMSRYVWHINGKAIFEDKFIDVKEGDVIRFEFVNHSMMHHPMHLHGHFFRVLNQNDEFSPLKHTVDVPPHGTRTIEFLASEPGQWMLHCHNLYHMHSGMARVVRYMDFKPKEEVEHHQHAGHDPHDHDHLVFYGNLEAATNKGEAQFKLTRTWDDVETRLEARHDTSWSGDGDLFYRRYFSQFFSAVIGGSAVDGNYRAIAGVTYVLPMLIRTSLYVDHNVEFRLDLSKRFQWTDHFFSDVDVILRQRLGSEFDVTLMYAPNWSWAAGLLWTEGGPGAALRYQF